MGTAEPVTVDECLLLMQRMAEDVQEYVDAAREAGSNAEASQTLLEEWEAFCRRTPLHWVNQCQEADLPPGLENL